MLQILKLAEDGTDAMNLSVNQTLEGHAGDVLKACWNSAYQKLTTTDSKGETIVWTPVGIGMLTYDVVL